MTQSRINQQKATVKTQGFSPVAEDNAKVLVLGTLPSQVSLAKGEYYAHAQNGFWRIMNDLFGVAPGLSYDERKCRLTAAGVALWDVCKAAHRPGSMDASIHAGSIIANDLAAFLDVHPQLRLICFNGSKAEHLFRRMVWPGLPDKLRSIPCQTLPSTSPANAATSYVQKLARWSVVRSACET